MEYPVASSYKCTKQFLDMTSLADTRSWIYKNVKNVIVIAIVKNVKYM